MVRYWVVAPYDSRESDVFDSAWKFDLENNTIAIGWPQLGDLSGLTRNDIRRLIEKVYPTDNEGNLTRDANCLWNFYNEIRVGDCIVARRGTKRLVGVGTVTRTAFYDRELGTKRVGHHDAAAYPHFLGVEWDRKEIAFDSIVFSFYTMYELPGGENHFRALVYTRSVDTPEDGQETSLQSQTFALETHLEEFLVHNFDAIFRGELQLYEDDDGNTGKQYRAMTSDGTLLGVIDVLAYEPRTRSYVVIELKAGIGSDEAVGQVLRYMGWVEENLCRDDETVRGIIICHEKDERLVYALRAIGDKISLKFYEMQFTLSDGPLLVQ